MPGKPIELPPEVAKALVADMRAFFAERSTDRALRKVHVSIEA